jgi:hypothetical protein
LRVALECAAKILEREIGFDPQFFGFASLGRAPGRDLALQFLPVAAQVEELALERRPLERVALRGPSRLGLGPFPRRDRLGRSGRGEAIGIRALPALAMVLDRGGMNLGHGFSQSCATRYLPRIPLPALPGTG